MVVLDASFLIDLEHGHDGALAAFHAMVEDQMPMRIPAQAAAEYIAGFEDPVANLNDLEQTYEVVAQDRARILETARLARASISTGDFPGWTDVQIAASAVLGNEPIATADSGDFTPFGCDVWDYRNEVRHPGD